MWQRMRPEAELEVSTYSPGPVNDIHSHCALQRHVIQTKYQSADIPSGVARPKPNLICRKMPSSHISLHYDCYVAAATDNNTRQDADENATVHALRSRV